MRHWSDVIKGASLAIVGVAFFANLKTDVAVSQADIAAIKSDVSKLHNDLSNTGQKVDRIYDAFVQGQFATRFFR